MKVYNRCTTTKPGEQLIFDEFHKVMSVVSRQFEHSLAIIRSLGRSFSDSRIIPPVVTTPGMESLKNFIFWISYIALSIPLTVACETNKL